MNDIYVENGPKKARQLTESVVEFCIRKMLPRHRSVKVWIEFEKDIDEWGFCYAGDNSHDIYISLNKCLLKKEARDDLIDTICHEMIHCKQIVRKQLVDFMTPPYCQKWLCRDGKYRRFDKLPHQSKPWEVEAYRDSWKYGKEFIDNEL